MSIEGITEEDIANYLVQNPGFFERHAQLLGTIALSSPHGQRAVSLQERQMQMMREKHKGLERRIMDMIRHGQDNEHLADKLYGWTRQMLLTADARQIPEVVTRSLQEAFLIPQVAMRVWGVAAEHADLPCAQGVSDDVKSFTQSLGHPYCGVNSGFEAASWLPSPTQVASLAMIPLSKPDGGTLGLLVIGSPDATRYSADMGTDFLTRISELASAGLSRLLPAPVEV